MKGYFFESYQGTPSPEVIEIVEKLYENIFETPPTTKFYDRMAKMPALFGCIAFATDGRAVGYKWGYALNEYTFYSWIGGVLENHRREGIAQKLLEIQHDDFCRAAGYQKVQTKTTMQWRNMLIFNLKNGFNIVETYQKFEGEENLRLVLEKPLDLRAFKK